jgi:malonyl-CoA O-methyltransferase
MHDWGDMLAETGFAEPVMDMERIVLTYADVGSLVTDLRGLGRNLASDRCATVRSRGWSKHWQQALNERLPRTPDGRFSLTFEVIYGHAFKPVPRVAVAAESAIPIGSMREMLRASQKPT